MSTRHDPAHDTAAHDSATHDNARTPANAAHHTTRPPCDDPAQRTADPHTTHDPARHTTNPDATHAAAHNSDATPHDSGHHTHSHAVPPDADRRYLWTAFGLIVAFMAVEVVAGLLAGSLVLLTDAAHMVSDAGAIGLALFAMRLADRPAAGAFTYGLKRAEILSALANGAALLGLGVFFVVEAIDRLVHPGAVGGVPVLVIAVVGIAVNLAATMAMRKADRRSLNVEAGFQHILTDLYAFIGTAIAGVVILTTGFVRADAIASLLVAALMIRAGAGLVRESGRVVLEAAPRGTDPATIRNAIQAMPDVVEVHELHVWEVTSGFPALSAHVLVDGHGDCHERRAELERLLADRFDIRHTTLQVDHPRHGNTPDQHVDDPGCPSAG